MMADAEKNSNLVLKFVRSLAPWIIGGALIGFLAGISKHLTGFDFWEFIQSVSPGFALDNSSLAALCVGGLLTFAGLMVLTGTIWPNLGLRMKVFSTLDDHEDQRSLFLHSSVGCIAWGALLVGLALVKPLGLTDDPAALSLLALLAAVLAYTCWQLFNAFDELWREVHSSTCIWAFYGLLVIGGGWSALAHLGSLPPLAPLDWITMLTAFSLIGSTIANGKRGLLQEHL